LLKYCNVSASYKYVYFHSAGMILIGILLL